MAKTVRLQQRLEDRANLVEAVLATHRAPARVTGGTVGPRVIRFFLDPSPYVRYGKIAALSDDLALALRTPAVRISRGTDGVVLEFANPAPYVMGFEGLMREIGPLPAATVILGVKTDAEPLLAMISSAQVAHILVAGTTGCGKTMLLRAILASLVLHNAPEGVRVMIIDPKRALLPESFSVPHLVRAVTSEDDIAGALRDVAHTMEVRDRRGEHLPRLVVFIDELADVVMNVEHAADAIKRLVARGRERGVHIIAATQHPAAAILSGVMKANFPLRLVGRVVSGDDARVAAGRGRTGAEKLHGHGDFLAVPGGAVVRFQAPMITSEKLAEVTAHIPAREVPRVVEVAPDMVEVQTVDETLERDTAALLTRAKLEGRMPDSKREAERWVFGKNRGGVFWTRTERALSSVYAAGFDVRKGATTTTKESGNWLVSKIRGIAG